MTPPGDLLETIAQAVCVARCEWTHDHLGVEDECSTPRDIDYGITRSVLAALLSDAGSTQWGVRDDVGHVGMSTAGEMVRGWAKRHGYPVVRRQVLELHGDWEEARDA